MSKTNEFFDYIAGLITTDDQFASLFEVVCPRGFYTKEQALRHKRANRMSLYTATVNLLETTLYGGQLLTAAQILYLSLLTNSQPMMMLDLQYKQQLVDLNAELQKMLDVVKNQPAANG